MFGSGGLRRIKVFVVFRTMKNDSNLLFRCLGAEVTATLRMFYINMTIHHVLWFIDNELLKYFEKVP
jgi:hypothetical protein